MCKTNCGSHGCMASKVAWTLVLVGAVNWGLVGAFDLDVVMTLFGSWTWLVDLIYVLVGVSGLVLLTGGCRCKKCKMGAAAGGENKEGCCGGKC